MRWELGRERDCVVSDVVKFGGVHEAVEVCVCWGVASLQKVDVSGFFSLRGALS